MSTQNSISAQFHVAVLHGYQTQNNDAASSTFDDDRSIVAFYVKERKIQKSWTFHTAFFYSSLFQFNLKFSKCELHGNLGRYGCLQNLTKFWEVPMFEWIQFQYYFIHYLSMNIRKLSTELNFFFKPFHSSCNNAEVLFLCNYYTRIHLHCSYTQAWYVTIRSLRLNTKTYCSCSYRIYTNYISWHYLSEFVIILMESNLYSKACDFI